MISTSDIFDRLRLHSPVFYSCAVLVDDSFIPFIIIIIIIFILFFFFQEKQYYLQSRFFLTICPSWESYNFDFFFLNPPPQKSFTLYSSASLFPARKWEAVTQGGTRGIHQPTWRKNQEPVSSKDRRNSKNGGAFQIYSHKTRIPLAWTP